MTVLDHATGEADELVRQMFGGMLQGITDAFFMSDAEMFAGLDARTVASLKDRLAANPDLRPALCQAARYRASRTRPVCRPAEFVYFIEATTSGLIKIGSASNPVGRLAALQTGSPERLRLLGTEPGGAARERELHSIFAADRSHGEWFHPSEALLNLIGHSA